MTTTNPEIERLVEEIRHGARSFVVFGGLSYIVIDFGRGVSSDGHDLQWFASKQPIHPDHLARVFGVKPGSHESNVLSAIQRVYSERYHQQQEKP